jgi:hypothetical protein
MSYSPTKEEQKMYKIIALEHLESLKDIVVAKDKHNGEDIRLEQTFQYGIIKRELYEYDKLKTPPTEQEVCEALGEFLNKKVYYEESPYRVFSTGLPVTSDNYIIEEQSDKLIAFNYDICELYPPHIITLIGRFYEGMVKDNEEHI